VIDFDAVKLRSDFNLFEVIFDTSFERKIAEEIIELIAETGEPLTIHDMRRYIEDNDYSERTVYYVLERLKKLGLIELRVGKYRLSNRFSKALRKIADKWDEFLEEGIIERYEIRPYTLFEKWQLERDREGCNLLRRRQ